MDNNKKYAISYNPLWHILLDRGIGRVELAQRIGAGRATITKMGKNEYVALEVIERICAELECQPGDIMECVIMDAK